MKEMEQAKISGRWYNILAIARNSITIIENGYARRVRKSHVQAYRMA